MQATYLLPIRCSRLEPHTELTTYLRWLAQHIKIIIVDGSDHDIFVQQHVQWSAFAMHIPPDPDLLSPMGKVGGVLTGVRHALHEKVVIADDDVRYDLAALERIVALLDQADVVRPQNYFDPLPWHARWDTGRTLLNRLRGGDWPGTLGVRRAILLRTGGYAGDVMFENFEMVRTIQAAGGSEVVPLDLYVRRLPPTTAHFWSQRARQAFDEWARPRRLVVFLALLPLTLLLALRGRWRSIAAGIGAIIGLAEVGRRRAGGQRVFHWTCSLFAPAWVAERAACAWLAVAMRLRYGGVRYGGGVIRRAATPLRELRARAATPLHSLAPRRYEPFVQADHGISLA